MNVTDSLNKLEALKEEFFTATGISPVIRNDLGLVIGYASTSTHGLEARGNLAGKVAFRINTEHYASADDIPASLRKLKKLATSWEVNADKFSPMMHATQDYGIAYEIFRAE